MPPAKEMMPGLRLISWSSRMGEPRINRAQSAKRRGHGTGSSMGLRWPNAARSSGHWFPNKAPPTATASNARFCRHESFGLAMLWRRANGIPERDMRAAESALLSFGGGASVRELFPLGAKFFTLTVLSLPQRVSERSAQRERGGSPNDLRVGAADGRIQHCRAWSMACFWIPFVRP